MVDKKEQKSSPATAAQSKDAPDAPAKTKSQPKAAAKKPSTRQAKMRKLTRGRVYIKSTYNNTVVTVTDLQGNAIAWQSAGALGFKGAKKSTPYAATQVVKEVIDKIKDTGLSAVDVFVRGIGGGRESAVRALHNYGLVVNSIKDVTPMPHNGCRPKKVRRV